MCDLEHGVVSAAAAHRESMLIERLMTSFARRFYEQVRKAPCRPSRWASCSLL